MVSRAGRGLPHYQERMARCARGPLHELIACHPADIDAAKLLRASCVLDDLTTLFARSETVAATSPP